MTEQIIITEEQLKKVLLRYDRINAKFEDAIAEGQEEKARRLDYRIEGMEIVLNMLGIDWVNLYPNQNI